MAGPGQHPRRRGPRCIGSRHIAGTDGCSRHGAGSPTRSPNTGHCCGAAALACSAWSTRPGRPRRCPSLGRFHNIGDPENAMHHRLIPSSFITSIICSNCSYIKESEGMSVWTLLTEFLLLDIIPLHDSEHVGSMGDGQHPDHLRKVDGVVRILPLHCDIATLHRGVASYQVFHSFRSRRVCLCAQIIPIYSEISKMTSRKKKFR